MFIVPNSLAYAIILLCTWFALKGKYFPLLITTIIGLQIREFTVVPLLAYSTIGLQQDGLRKSVRKYGFTSVGLLIGFGLPRLFIPIINNELDVQFSLAGIQQVFYLLSLWKRDINLLYVCFAYFLPVIILYRPARKN